MHDVFSDVAEALRVQDFERLQQPLGSLRLELICHEDVEHEGFEFFVLDVVGGLVVFEAADNVVTHLRLRGELQQVSHYVRDLSIEQTCR